jgi:hypothetical protein
MGSLALTDHRGYLLFVSSVAEHRDVMSVHMKRMEESTRTATDVDINDGVWLEDHLWIGSGKEVRADSTAVEDRQESRLRRWLPLMGTKERKRNSPEPSMFSSSVVVESTMVG